MKERTAYMQYGQQRENAPRLIDRFATEWVIWDESENHVEQDSQPADARSGEGMPVSLIEEMRIPGERLAPLGKAIGAA